jgi:hypothetical protein
VIRFALASLVVAAAAPVAAQPAPDLRVERLPVQLKLPARKRTAQAAAEPTDAAAADAAESSLTSFTPIPRSARDWAERVTLKVRLGMELDSAGASGDPVRGGAALPTNFTGSRPWIVGDAVVGVRDILLPSLGADFLSSFQLDASDSLATRTAFVRPYDADDSYAIAIKAGYAEWGRDDRRPDQKLWLRGGRQFRLDGGALFAYFDGATVGYRTKGIEASAFAGQRVALYVDTPHGILFGATAALDLKTLREVPARIAIDYMGLAVDGVGVVPDGMGGTEPAPDATRQLVALTGSYEASKQLKLDVRARLVDAQRDDDGDGVADGFALGRVGARLRAERKRMIVLVDVEHRDGGDLAYDLASPSAVDVVAVSRQLGVGLAAPVSATTIGAQVDYRRKDAELLGFARLERPDSAADVTEVSQRGWIEVGAAVAGAPLGNRAGGVYATGQYKLRQYADLSGCDVRDTASCMDGDRNDGAGSTFGDSSTSGLNRLHELALDATLRSEGKGPRRWRFQLGAFYRVYDFGSPYAEVTDEGRAGGRADLQYWLARDLRIDAGAEVAEPSPVLARELGVMSAVRAAVEARW